MKIKLFEIVLNVFDQSIKEYIRFFSVLCFFLLASVDLLKFIDAVYVI